MKKNLVVFAALLAVALAACGGSDKSDEPSYGGSVVGTWSCDLMEEMEELYSDLGIISGVEFVQFKSDGTWVMAAEFEYDKDWYGKSREIEIQRGTYRLSDGKMYLTYTYFSDEELSKTMLGKTDVCEYEFIGAKLRLTTIEGLIVSSTFTKVSDNAIKKYL